MEDDGQGGPPDGTPAPTRSTLLSTYWRDPEYLAHVPLTAATALDYFCRSTFFDPASTNEMLRMQNIANPDGAAVGAMVGQGTGLIVAKTARQLEEELARFVGIEFVLVHAKQGNKPRDGHISPVSQPHQAAGGAGAGGTQHLADETLFVIQKRRRQSPLKTTVLETYYILNGNVHVAPDLDTVLNNRMTTALVSLRDALSLARNASGRPILPVSTSSRSAELGKAGKGPSGSAGKVNATTHIEAGPSSTLGAEASALSEQLAREAALPDDQSEEPDVEMLENLQ